jgi:AraC family ethanolamine operon transcriptional activator
MNARSEENTVIAIAASFGFLKFGRFSAEYRALFGALPSATLRRTRSLP